MRKLVALALVVVASAACSVTTPRRGTTAGGPGPQSAGPSSAPGPVRSGSNPAAPGAPAGAAPSGSAGATAGPGSPVVIAPSGGGASGGSAPAPAAASGETSSGADEAVAPGGTSADGGSATATPGDASAGPAPVERTASDVGVTPDTIAVSVIAGFSGPLAPVVQQAYPALETWRDEVNANGGIHGRQVILKPVDHKETADGGVAACKEALSNGTFFAMVPEGIEANVTAVSCLDQAGVPTLYYSAIVDPAWTRALGDTLTSAQGGTVLGRYVHRVLGGSAKKVGVLYVNQLAYKAAADTYVAEARHLGTSVVRNDPVEPNQASFTSQLLQMQQAGVEILVISATAEAIGILRDARSMNYTPTFTGFGFEFDFITAAGRNLFDGVTGIKTSATVDTPAYESYAALMEKHGRGRDRVADTEGFLTYGHGLMTGELLTRAGANPTRDSFVAGAETVQNYDNGILGPVNFGPGQHEGAKAAFPVICCNPDYTWKGLGPPQEDFVQ